MTVSISLQSTMFLLIRHSLCQGKRPRETLHSTMFLLIRKLSCRSPILQSSFTFHNVSINTAAPAPWANQVYLPLHSTMFLLIQRCLKCRQVLIFFTFHNVSINTKNIRKQKNPDDHLYIPQCFY